MSIQIVRATPEHAESIARIVYEAFADVSQRHGFDSDIYDIEVARALARSFLHRPDMYGVVAIDEGDDVIGINFAQTSDAVAGIGPICVDPARQCKGVGRMLMQHLVDYALANHGPMVRLLQESFNMASLSLYASIGFVVREPVALMSVPPPAQSEPNIRPLTPDDVEAADALVTLTQKVSRKNELLGMIGAGPSIGAIPHGCFAGDRLTACVVPGFIGFAGAQRAADLLATSRAAVVKLPPPMQRILIPVRNGELFAAALREGFKSIKVLQLMSIGPYDDPVGHWAPSISY